MRYKWPLAYQTSASIFIMFSLIQCVFYKPNHVGHVFIHSCSCCFMRLNALQMAASLSNKRVYLHYVFFNSMRLFLYLGRERATIFSEAVNPRSRAFFSRIALEARAKRHRASH